MNVSLFRLVCIGLFLFVATSVRVDAASLRTGGYPVFCSSAVSPVLNGYLNVAGDSLVGIAAELIEYRMAWQAPLGPFTVCSFSGPSILVSTSASPTVLSIGKYDCSNQYTWSCYRIETSAVADVTALDTATTSVADYSIQDILICGFALIAMCAGWGVGVRLA